MSQLERLEMRHGFYKIGTYEGNAEGGVNRRVEEGIRVSERLSLVYAICVDREVTYVGKTVQGYRRPLGYHKNEVMRRVRDGIREALADNRCVEVYARSENLDLEVEGLQLNLIDPIENALISELQPEWNRFNAG